MGHMISMKTAARLIGMTEEELERFLLKTPDAQVYYDPRTQKARVTMNYALLLRDRCRPNRKAPSLEAIVPAPPNA